MDGFSRFYPTIVDTIGLTPLIRMQRLGNDLPAQLLLKLEFFNPLGSVKDRIGAYMILQAEKRGELKQGMKILEPTSGNTGIALAFVAASKGYPLILVMPETMSTERRTLLLMLGAELILTPGPLGMKGAISKAEEIYKAAASGTYYMPRQFDNPDNPEIHRLTTAQEIWKDTNGKVDMLVAGIGTGGTLTGVGAFLKERKSSVQMVAVEPEESSVLSGNAPGPHKIQGIGAGFVPSILDRKLIDHIERVSSAEAISTARRVIKEEGIPIGISSGAVITAGFRQALKEENRGKLIVCVLASNTERYLSTLLCEEERQRALALKCPDPSL